jgi:hypothetical protein
MDEQTIRSATTTQKEEDYRNFGTAGGSRNRGGKQVPNSICTKRKNSSFITNHVRSILRPMLMSLEIITLTLSLLYLTFIIRAYIYIYIYIK